MKHQQFGPKSVISCVLCLTLTYRTFAMLIQHLRLMLKSFGHTFLLQGIKMLILSFILYAMTPPYKVTWTEEWLDLAVKEGSCKIREWNSVTFGLNIYSFMKCDIVFICSCSNTFYLHSPLPFFYICFIIFYTYSPSIYIFLPPFF